MVLQNKNSSVFTSLRKFWYDYIKMQIHTFNLNHQFFSIRDFLKSLFGNLTEIEIEDIKKVPFKVSCTNCRNNTENRLSSVCETHIGCLKGTLEGILNIPLDIEYNPVPNETCTIMVKLSNDENGNSLCAKGKIKDGVAVFSDNQLNHFWIQNRLTGHSEVVSRELFLLLEQLHQFKSVKEVSTVLNLPFDHSSSLMDKCYRQGWIECNFFRENEPLN